jgi:hypothetical protein
MAKFPAEELSLAIDDDSEMLKKKSYKLIDKGRWRSNYWFVFADADGKFYGVNHEEPNDENCDATPWNEDADGNVECTPLVRCTKMTTVYATQRSIDESDGKLVPAE